VDFGSGGLGWGLVWGSGSGCRKLVKGLGFGNQDL
jgi:hypothetical protein